MSRWLFLGDSHTFGQSGFPICDAIAEARPDVNVVNAGVNADLAWNLAERMGDALRPSPTLVHVLIGTNDVNAGLHPDHAAGYLRDKGLPELPTLEFYRIHLRRVFDRLRQTGAILFASQIPPIGDDRESSWNVAIEQYNTILAEEAMMAGVKVLPLFDRLMDSVDTSRIHSIDRTDWGVWIPESQRLHDQDGMTWNAIADQRALQLMHDGLHMTERAGRIWLKLLLEEFDAAR